jgi:hypothetical protein
MTTLLLQVRPQIIPNMPLYLDLLRRTKTNMLLRLVLLQNKNHIMTGRPLSPIHLCSLLHHP